jgi:hypothetical protein
VADYFEHGYGLLDSMREWNFLDRLSKYQLLKKDFAACNLIL